MSEPVDPNHLEEDISVHIFAASAGMVGVCLTVIGLFRVSDRLTDMSNVGDVILSVDALIFLTSCLFSYYALRTRTRRRRPSVEKTADIFFLVGLSLMAAVCGLIAYEFI